MVELVSARGVPCRVLGQSMLVNGVKVSVRGVNILIDHKSDHPPGQKIISEAISERSDIPRSQVKGHNRPPQWWASQGHGLGSWS